jgi:hypothetical protein|nr:MAG TPA: hypothetical protein [Caudoviricetes sp.]
MTSQESQESQVDAMAVINALTAEIARLTQRAVIAETRCADLEAKINKENK